MPAHVFVEAISHIRYSQNAAAAELDELTEWSERAIQLSSAELSSQLSSRSLEIMVIKLHFFHIKTHIFEYFDLVYIKYRYPTTLCAKYKRILSDKNYFILMTLCLRVLPISS